jgi:LemA protein
MTADLFTRPVHRLLAPLLLAAAALLTGCGYNQFQTLDEQTKAAWSEVLNQYQRRADLIPNIVATVKGEANFEQETLNDPQAFARFQQAQGELGGALSRLLMVTENYPNLKANQAFQDLRVQLEGTENRITVARNRYIKAVQEYNVLARQFPSNLTAMVFGYGVKPNFSVANEAAISAPPSVSFDKGVAPAAPAAPAASR